MDLQPAEQRRQRQRTEARRSILDAAETLLVRDGYEGFSMRRLAERCGYTTPTIYHYFGDKKGLLDALLDARLRGLLRRMKRVALGEDPVENWRHQTLAFIRFGLKHPTHYQLLMMPRGADEPLLPVAEQLIELMLRPFSALQEAGRLVAGDVEAARQAVWAMVHGLISLQNGLPDVAWQADLDASAVALLERGLILAPGARA